MGLQITADYSDLEKELKRMESEPSAGSIAGFEISLAHAFADVTSRVHVITGALRGSGKTASDASDTQWEGQMTWGGPSPGFLPRPDDGHRRHENHPAEDELARNEVVYAWYEKRRGSAHDYLAGQEVYTESFRLRTVNAVLGIGP